MLVVAATTTATTTTTTQSNRVATRKMSSGGGDRMEAVGAVILPRLLPAPPDHNTASCSYFEKAR